MVDDDTLLRLSSGIAPGHLLRYLSLKPAERPLNLLAYLKKRRSLSPYIAEDIKRHGSFLEAYKGIDPANRFEFVSFFLFLRKLFRSGYYTIDGDLDRVISKTFRMYRKAQSAAFSEAFKYLDTNIIYSTVPGLTLDEFIELPSQHRISLQNRIIVKTTRNMIKIYNDMCSSVPDLKGKKVLNIGDGVDYEASFLRHLFENDKIPDEPPPLMINADNRGSIKELKKQFRGFPKDRKINLSFLQADATMMPFKDDHFDVIIASFMIDDCLRHDYLFSESARVLKPDGIMLLSGHHPDPDNPTEHFVHTFGHEHVNQSSLDSAKQLGKKYNFRMIKSSGNRNAYMAKFVLKK